MLKRRPEGDGLHFQQRFLSVANDVPCQASREQSRCLDYAFPLIKPAMTSFDPHLISVGRPRYPSPTDSLDYWLKDAEFKEWWDSDESTKQVFIGKQKKAHNLNREKVTVLSCVALF